MLGLKTKTDKKEPKNFFNDQWKEVELIGEGSFGKVYKAKKEEFGLATYCAIKQIEIPQTQSEINSLKSEGHSFEKITEYYEEVIKKWVEEIQFMSIFKDSPNIVNIEDFEIIRRKNGIGCTINIKMELLTNLDAYILNKKIITDKETIKMAIDILTALEDCEQKDVLHRDIKPENIFVNSKGVYKLGDFGTAKKIDSSVSNLSKKGTENYMAPELFKNEKGNKTIDIYSLGIVLYRYFNYNRLPFLPNYPQDISINDREDALYKRISGEKIAPPLNATREIAEIILKACSYYSKDRYENATEFKLELQKIYDRIVTPKVIFDFKNKDIPVEEKIESKVHDGTISVANSNNSKKIENREIIEEKNEEQIVENQEIKKEKPQLDEEVNKEEPKENQIKSKLGIKLKNNKKKIIVAISVILIALIILLVSLLRPKQEKPQYIIMKNYIGMQSEEATNDLKSLELEVEYEYIEIENEEEIGKVLEQSINENEQISKGTVVILKVAVSPEKVKVINVVGYTIEEAKTMLEGIELNVTVTEQYNDTVEQGKVISQMPLEGEEVNKHSTVELLVSLGKEITEETPTEQAKPQQTTNPKQPTGQQTQTQTQQQTNPTPQTQQPTQSNTPKVIAPTGITLGNTQKFIEKGKTAKITATVSPSNATNQKVVWSSNNQSVVSVTQDGTIKGVGNTGKTTITATVEGTNILAKFEITVYIKGDLDGDGNVTPQDASMAGDIFKRGKATEEELLRADLDGNGIVDTADMAVILNMYKYKY